MLLVGIFSSVVSVFLVVLMCRYLIVSFGRLVFIGSYGSVLLGR